MQHPLETNPLSAVIAEGEPVGCEWVIDAFDCDPRRLRTLIALQQLCDEIIGGLQLNVVQKPMWHQFPGPAGVTGLYLLSESHLACHTYPEYGLATFNLYCCRDIPSWPWSDRLGQQLLAGRVEVMKLARGRTGGFVRQSTEVVEAGKGFL
jgi:S-adenosylmethionine decarboxylase